MRVLADENISPSLVHALRNAGHDVFDVKEAGWFGKSDHFLVSYAVKEQRIILTHDKDFTYQEKIAAVLMRFRNQKSVNVEKYLLAFLNSPSARRLRKPVIAIITEYGVELHHPYGL